MKYIDGNVSKNISIFYRIDKYCVINYIIKYIFTLKAVLIKTIFYETFLVKVKSEILKYFFLYDVIIVKWNTCVISSDPPILEWHSNVPLKPSFLHLF